MICEPKVWSQGASFQMSAVNPVIPVEYGKRCTYPVVPYEAIFHFTQRLQRSAMIAKNSHCEHRSPLRSLRETLYSWSLQTHESGFVSG